MLKKFPLYHHYCYIFHRIPFADWPSSPIHLRSVLCDGTESNITSCRHTSVTSVDSTITSHGQDVFVVCRPRDQQSYSGNSIKFNSITTTCNVIITCSVVHPGGVQGGDIRLFGDFRNGHGAVQI